MTEPKKHEESKDHLRIITVYTCHSTSVGEMVTGWAGRQDAPQLTIYQALRELADKPSADADEPTTERDQYLEKLFREQDQLDLPTRGDSGILTRFKHMMQRTAARNASVVTSVRSVVV